MINSTIHEILKSHLISSENFIYGFANLSGLLHKKFNGFSHGISIGRRLDDSIIDGIIEAPTIEYFHHYDEINKQLQSISEKIASYLNEVGIGGLAIIPTLPISSTEFDQYLFISKKFGARLRLGSILIDKEVESDRKPIDKSRCGSCSICVEKCPAQAATGQSWDIHTDRDIFFDAFKCREKCSEFGRTLLKIDKRICGICIAVCPIGRGENQHKL